jgi:hypothetical protein
MRVLCLTVLGLLSALPTVEAQRRFSPDSMTYGTAGTAEGRIRGVAVRLDSNGDAATFDAAGTVWRVTCGETGETAGRSCWLVQPARTTALTLVRQADGNVLVRVGEERSTYVGTDVQLRVDEGPMYTVREPGWNAALSAEIVNALRSGRSVMTSFIQWPSSDYIDAFLDLRGIDVALEFMEFAVQ